MLDRLVETFEDFGGWIHPGLKDFSFFLIPAFNRKAEPIILDGIIDYAPIFFSEIGISINTFLLAKILRKRHNAFIKQVERILPMLDGLNPNLRLYIRKTLEERRGETVYYEIEMRAAIHLLRILNTRTTRCTSVLLERFYKELLSRVQGEVTIDGVKTYIHTQ